MCISLTLGFAAVAKAQPRRSLEDSLSGTGLYKANSKKATTIWGTGSRVRDNLNEARDKSGRVRSDLGVDTHFAPQLSLDPRSSHVPLTARIAHDT
jgi:hypothetical protein